MLAKRVAVLSPTAADGPQRLAAAGARRVLIVGGSLAPSPGVEVWAGPLATPLRLPLRDASVDAVLCIEPYAGLSLADREALVEEARRVLRSGGVLAVWSAELPDALALLSPAFAQVEALGERRWSGVSLGPVGAAEGLRLVDERPSASAAATSGAWSKRSPLMPFGMTTMRLGSTPYEATMSPRTRVTGRVTSALRHA